MSLPSISVINFSSHLSDQDVQEAIKDALRVGAIGFDAVKHLLLCRIEHRPPRLELDNYPYLPSARVDTTSASDYMSLLPGARS